MAGISEHKSNVYSQYGEDGIVKEVLDRLSKNGAELNKWVCEFGAWDGLHLSNAARLIIEDGFRAVLIESDAKRVRELEANFPAQEIVKLCSFVGHNGPTSLESLLSTTQIPIDFDFLSIDIDGMDYYIMKSLNRYRPKLICIEFNPSIPNAVHFVQPENYKVKQGSSARAISELAATKGYTLVAATLCNLFFLLDEYCEVLDDPKPTLDELVPGGKDATYIFAGYDGSVLSNKSAIDLPWHGSFPIKRLQILPKFLREYSGDYNKLQWLLLRVIKLLKGEKGKRRHRLF